MDMEAFEAFQDKDGYVSRDKLQVASHFMHKQWVKDHPSSGNTTPQGKVTSPPPSSSSKKAKDAYFATSEKHAEGSSKKGPQPQAGLRLPPVEGLQWLDLSGHRHLGDAGAAQIATAVSLGCRALRGLDLSRLGSLGHAPLLMTALCGPLGSNGRPGLFFQTRHLEVLHLRGNVLTTRAVCRLLAALTNHPPGLSISNSSNSGGNTGRILASTSSPLTNAMPSPLKETDSDRPISPSTGSRTEGNSGPGSSQRWNLPRPKWPGSGDVSSSPGSSSGHPLLPSSSSDALVWGGINTSSRGLLKQGWRQGWRGLEELSLDGNNLTVGLGLGPASSSSNNPLLSHLRSLLTRNPANGLRVLGLSNPIASLPSRAGLGESGGREIVMGLMANYATSTLHSIRLEGCGVDLESLNVIHAMLAKNRAQFASKAQAAMHRPSRAPAAATKTSTTTTTGTGAGAAEGDVQTSAQKGGTPGATTAITTSGRRLSDTTMKLSRGQSGSEHTAISASHSPGRAWSSLTDLPQSSHEVPTSSLLPRDDANAATPASPSRHYQENDFPGELAPASIGNNYNSRDDGQETLTRTNSGRWLSLDGQRSRRANSDPPPPISMLNAPSNWQRHGQEQGLKPEALEGMEDLEIATVNSTSGTKEKLQPDALSLTNDIESVDGATAAGSTVMKTELATNAGVVASSTSNDASLTSSTSEGFEGLHFSVLFSAPLAWRDSRGTLTPIQMLDHESEKDMLAQTFREAKRPIRLDFSYATTEKLRSLVTLGCHALHFSGHGHPRCLTFEDGAGGLQAVHHERLRALVGAAGGTSGSSQSSFSPSSMRSSATVPTTPSAALTSGGFGSGAPQLSSSSSSSSGPSLRFVFVSACHSHLSGQAFADAGVPHVVCVKKEAELLDSAALCFTRAFYLALAVGRTVADSFAIGREAVASSPHVEQERALAEADKFLLLPQLKGPHDRRHDVPVFGPGAEALALSRNQLPFHIRTMARPPLVGAADVIRNPMPPEDFIGREVRNVLLLMMKLVRVAIIGVLTLFFSFQVEILPQPIYFLFYSCAILL